jgi:large subunit ribosomal protein L10
MRKTGYVHGPQPKVRLWLPSETVGEGSSALLISSLDGEQVFHVCSDVGARAIPSPRGLKCHPEEWSAGCEVENGMDRAQKPVLVADLNAVFGEVGVVVVTRNLGLTVAQSTVLRNKMREAGATYKVTKNSLAKIAAKGTAYEGLSALLTGPIALASSVDPVAAAKVVVEFAKTNDKLEIVGGSMGSDLLTVDGVKALATLPSLDELRAKIVGLIQAPATKLVQIIQAPAGQLARVLGAYATKEAA